MSNSEPQQDTSRTGLAIEDPRYGLATVVGEMRDMITAATDHLDSPTPCPEFSVRDLLDHVVMVMRRVAVIGNGEPFDSVQQEELGAGWAEAFGEAAVDTHKAWADDAKLGQMFMPPWGETPGAVTLLIYTSELAVHGWDLEQATGTKFNVDDQDVTGALFAAKQLPAEGRDSPEMPFDPVVQVSDKASAVEQMAAWMGRKVVA